MKFTSIQKREVKARFSGLTSQELFRHLTANFGLGCQFTSFRKAVYDLGLKKCKVLRWTTNETDYLLQNYQTKGNIEIAKNLSKSGRTFTKKNINKKMNLLGIKRAPEDLDFILKNHVAKGTYHRANVKRHEKTKIQEGETRIHVIKGRPMMMIKANGFLTPYFRHRYKELYGEVPKGWKVYPKDFNFRNLADENIIAKPASGNTMEERRLYKKFYDDYFAEISAQNPKVIKVAPKEMPKETKQNLIVVKINSKTTLKVKPGTDIEALRAKYNQKTPSYG